MQRWTVLNAAAVSACNMYLYGVNTAVLILTIKDFTDLFFASL